MNTNQSQNYCYPDFRMLSQTLTQSCGWINLDTLNSLIVSLNTIAESFWIWNNSIAMEDIYQRKELEISKYCEWWVQMIPSSKDKVDYFGLYNPLINVSTNKRSRKTLLPRIDENLINLFNLAKLGQKISFKPWSKSARGLHHGVSVRRSQYIGVLRNRDKWQVLLNEGKIKKYIGTYESEKEAAIVNDFYSIGINGRCAKTNFSYNQDKVLSMISSYFDNNRQFIPSIFALQLY